MIRITCQADANEVRAALVEYDERAKEPVDCGGGCGVDVAAKRTGVVIKRRAVMLPDDYGWEPVNVMVLIRALQRGIEQCNKFRED